MFFEKDIIRRQIEVLVNISSKVLLSKDAVNYEPDEEKEEEVNELYKRVIEYIKDGEIGRAEDEMYDAYNPGSDDYTELAIDFYQRLNELEDEELENADFEREEVRDGLCDFMRRMGIPDDVIMGER